MNSELPINTAWEELLDSISRGLHERNRNNHVVVHIPGFRTAEVQEAERILMEAGATIITTSYSGATNTTAVVVAEPIDVLEERIESYSNELNNRNGSKK